MCCGSWQARHSRVDNKKQKKDWHSASPFLLDRNHALHTYAVLGLVAGCAALIACVGEKIIRCAAVEVVPGAQLPPNVKAERHHACRNGDPADCACQGTRFCFGFRFLRHRLTPGTIGRLQKLKHTNAHTCAHITPNAEEFESKVSREIHYGNPKE
jgi:hypothetical protein